MAYLPVEVLHSIHLNHIATDAPLQVIREVIASKAAAAKRSQIDVQRFGSYDARPIFVGRRLE